MRVKGLEKWEDRVIPCELGNGNIAYYVNFANTDIEVGLYIKNEDRLEVFDNLDAKLVSIILQYRNSKERLRLFYGDIHTGRSWNEEYNVTGSIGRTCGNFKVPVLLNNSRSYGGEAISIGSLIRIDEISTHQTLWQVPNFHVEKLYVKHTPVNKDYPYAVMQLRDKESISNIANFKTETQAKHWIDFMYGKRYCK